MDDLIWRELDKQSPDEVQRRLAQGVYGKANEASVRKWLEVRGGDPEKVAQRRTLKDRIKLVLQVLLSG